MHRGVLSLLAVATAAAQTHPVPVSNGWFPSDPAALNQLLDRAFAVAAKRLGPVPPRSPLLGLIAPHAALAFSGSIAASAYSRLENPPDVIVLAFSHRERHNGVLAPRLASYKTPLGEIPVNQEALKQLGFTQVPEERVCDHSLENQLPFIQRAAPKARVIPLYVGDLTSAELKGAARKLFARVKAGDVIVASSDFTHYGAAYGYSPFEKDALLGPRLRARFLESAAGIGTLSVPAFDAFRRSTNDNLCGWSPIRLLMATLSLWSEDVFLSPLDYVNSGEITGDWTAAVSYGALAFYPYSAYNLSAASRAVLLETARRTLKEYLAGRKPPKPLPPPSASPELDQRSGVFVTIKRGGRLRGCVGDIAAREPLWTSVPERTIEAATADPRFPPLSPKEGPVSLEISVLTPVKRLPRWQDFTVGHGVILQLNGKSATFLPQIPVEMGWTGEQTLEELSRKAGLPPDAYRDRRAVLYVYSAHVFGD